MELKLDKNLINLHAIADSGQCFRMNRAYSPQGQLYYDVYSADKFVRVFAYVDHYSFDCIDEEVDFWRNYFDLDTDYTSFFEKISESKDIFLNNAARYGKGLRILRQDFWEMLISFIISQNNSISRIKKIVADFCRRFGKQFSYHDEIHYTFPSREELAGIQIEDLQDLGLGYRDTYILNACQCSSELIQPAEESLLQLVGVGPKVMNCVLLYGDHQIDRVPIDVWMKRIYDNVYGGTFDDSAYVGFKGFIQLLQFYYYRHLDGKLNE